MHIRIFILIFFHMMICHSKRHGKSNARLTVQVNEMEADSIELSTSGRTSLSQGVGKDGIQEQVVLLNRLSVKLDEYFKLRSFGPGNDRTG